MAAARRQLCLAAPHGYGTPVPAHDEAHPTAINPYGRTKLHIEEILRDLAVSDDRWRIAALRY